MSEPATPDELLRRRKESEDWMVREYDDELDATIDTLRERLAAAEALLREAENWICDHIDASAGEDVSIIATLAAYGPRATKEKQDG